MCLVCFIDHICYKYYRHSQNEELNERKTEKQRIVDFDGKWRPGWPYGDGGWGGQNILPNIIDLLGPFREIWEYTREISGNSHGKNCPTFIAINQLAVKITRPSLSFGYICINSSTCLSLSLSFGLSHIKMENYDSNYFLFFSRSFNDALSHQFVFMIFGKYQVSLHVFIW